jgi:radical SAM superfamily enzyme YgiQ (UPF0313 family)
MRILTLNPPYLPRYSRGQRSPAVTKSGTLYYPIWLAYATGILEQAGHQVRLVDAPAADLDLADIVRLAQDFRPELVAIETSTPSIYNDVHVGEAIKSVLPNCFVVLVGTHVSALPEETLVLSTATDAVARREYDYTLRDLAAALEAGHDTSSTLSTSLTTVAGLSYRYEGRVIHNPDRSLIQDLDSLPFVSQVYSRHLHIPDYFYAMARHPVVTLITGRGCPYACTFCLFPQTLHMRGYRCRSVENVVAEFEWIQEHLPHVRDIFIEDDTFTVNHQRCRELCQALIARGLRLTWTANARADVDYETLRLMRVAGCRSLCVGFESGDQAILDNMGKSITVEKMRAFMADARRAGILVHGCFMVGNPGETRATMERTLAFAQELNPDTAQFFPIMVYPGTAAYEWARAKGYLTTQDFSQWLTPTGMHNTVVSYPWLTAEEMVAFCDRARRSFYLRPRYIVAKLTQMLTRPREAGRTIKSLRIFAPYLKEQVIQYVRGG